MSKKNIGIPLQKYIEQIKQTAKRHNYKLSGEIKLTMKSGDTWTYTFNEEK